MHIRLQASASAYLDAAHERCAPETTATELTQVAVEVNHADGPVHARDAAKQRERDGVVAAERQDARVELPVLREALARVRARGRARHDRGVRELELAERNPVVGPDHRCRGTVSSGEGAHRGRGGAGLTDVSAIDDVEVVADADFRVHMHVVKTLPP